MNIKTNKVLEWFVVDKFGSPHQFVSNRRNARMTKNTFNQVFPLLAPFRIVKSVVTK